MKDLGGLMKQAKKMQEDLQKAQEEVANLEVTGQAGGGLVKITLSGSGEAKGVSIDKTLMDPEETDVLEDLLLAAFADAKRKADEETQERMKSVTGGLGGMLPPGMKMPF